MQFERPIVFVALSVSDYTSGVGGTSRFDLLVGDDLASAVALPEYGHRREFTFPPEDLIDGGFLHVVGNGKGDPSPSVSAIPASISPSCVSIRPTQRSVSTT
jgi:hypothetical protein